MVLQFIRRILETRPALAISLVGAALALAVQFGLNISDVQIEAIKDFLAQVVSFVAVGFGIQSVVYSPATHAEEVAAAAAQE